MERRLAAILAADVAGYSRLMGQDEIGTLAALKALRSELVDPKIAEHKGRIFKATGDGLLTEFPSVVNAVACAVDIQRGIKARNADVYEDRAIYLRIGVNLGDIIVEGDDIFGDGVNVAARLEGVAPPAGIVISSTVRDHLGSRLDLQFGDMGEHVLKNIERPVRIYQVHLSKVTAEARSTLLPDKPSIAVLPFQNMSGDSEQEYFADGLTEDIITELARFSSLIVIARNSSFQWRNRSEDVKKIGQSLGAQYLVEGSVRRRGTSIRITAQLINATTGSHLWSERYDRRLEQLFDIQDEVVRAIVTTTEHRVMDTAADLLVRRPPNSWAAHDHYLRGRKYLAHYDTFAKAELPLHQAIELDPMMAEAHAGLAHVIVEKYWQKLDLKLIGEAHAHAHKALSINPNLSDAHDAMSTIYAFRNDIERAIATAERALVLNPNNVMAAVNHAQWLIFAGRCEQALDALEGILRRDPIPPSWYWDTKGTALFQLRRYREAIDAYYTVNDRQRWQNAYIAASLAYLGRIEEARSVIAALLESSPDMSIGTVLKIDPYQTEDARAHLTDGLRKAGLRE